MLRWTLFLLLACWAVVADTPGAAQRPKIGRPITVPPTPMPPLPPAVIDNSLAIGGEDIDARKVNTRMTVEVHVNGRGPYQFLVDSGADTSVVGLRIASDLELPLGTPTILHATTASARVVGMPSACMASEQRNSRIDERSTARPSPMRE